jgi:predicted AlkP superfamily pyrophosphatase or phosphodiesterase
LMKEGAWASRMTIVNPAVTWPNHTTLVTGVDARKHGVLFNGLLMRDAVPPKVEPWVDKDKWVRARTVYDAAFEAGLTTAQVDWVAIYNAKTITWQFPEKPDADGPIEREMVAQGIVTRQDVSEFLGKSNPAWRDQIWTEAAAHIIRQHKPNLLLFHLLNLDTTHHAYGPRTTASYAGIAYADTRVQQILDALAAAGMKDRSTVIIVSDHGFKSVQRNIRPNAVLKKASLGDAANVVPEGGTAMLYTTKPGADATVIERLRAAFDGIEGIDRIVEPKDYAALGLPTPVENHQAPELLLVARDTYAFAGGNAEPIVADAPTGTGQHGYLNTDPEMDAIFIAWGRGIRPGAHADRIRNVDVAPTIASLLGLQLTGVEGRPLSQFLAPK